MRARIDAAALRRARRARGLTQAGLARILGVAGGERVSAWERGVNQPDVALLPLMAATLEVEPALLLGRSRAPRDLRALRWSAGSQRLRSRLPSTCHVTRTCVGSQVPGRCRGTLHWCGGSQTASEWPPRSYSRRSTLAQRPNTARPVTTVGPVVVAQRTEETTWLARGSRALRTS